MQPQLSELVRLAEAELGTDGRLLTPSGPFRFYFPARVTQTYPASCADLRGYDAFVLLTDEGTRAYMRDVLGVPDDPAFWSSCANPPLTVLASVPGHVFYRVGP